VMEPIGQLERLSHVQQPDAATMPAFDPGLHLVVEAGRPSFSDFYAATRDNVGRALAVTLRDGDLAADAVDEAMVRAYQRWDAVSAMDNPAGWVYRVGLNHARSRIRRLTRYFTDDRHEGIVSAPFVEPAIMRALGELSVDHRSVVVCRLLLGWSEADTAAALGIRPGTVKSRLSRALAQLETRLAHLRPGVTNQPHPDEERS